MFKKTCVGLCLIMISVLFTGCVWDSWASRGGAPDYSSVLAIIDQSYYENFDAKEYTLESFNLTNVKNFQYRFMPFFDVETEEESIGERFFFINLKNTGKQHAQNALDHLIQFEFISRVSFSHGGTYYGELME